MDALFELPARAELRLGLRRACQAALLRGRLEAAGPAGAPAREFLAASWLETLPLAELVRHATPFFWLNVVRCHAACGRAGAGPNLAPRHLLMTGFDAFFPVAPDGFSCPLPPGDDPVVLPRLGVRLPASDGPVRLERAGRRVLRVEVGGGRTTTIPLDGVPPGVRLAWLPVGCGDSARLLLNPHPALFPPSDAVDVPTDPPDPEGQAAMIASAVELIREVDPRRGEQIATAIRWYAPLLAPDPEVRRSQTSPDLRGVIFLSPGRDRRMLAELIVHEYYHGVLNTRMELQPLLVGGGEARFYSPWRQDPRPLPALLHALYVFTGIAEFLLAAEGSRAVADQRDAIRDRRRAVIEQLRLGHAQAPTALFTPQGRTLLEGLRQIIDWHETDLELPRDRLPDAQAAHLHKWRASHPHLAAGVRRPAPSGA